MKQSYFKIVIVLACIFFGIDVLHSQTTEDFETETIGSTTFTDNGQNFTITNGAGETTYDIETFAGAGWNGSAPDNQFIDNSSGSPIQNDGSSFTVTTTDGTDIEVKSLYVFIATRTLGIPSTTLTITGRVNGGTVYTITKSSGFSNVATFTPNNGFTFIDFSTEGGSDNSNTLVDEIIISASNNGDYIALDAFLWDLAPVCTDPNIPTVTFTPSSICDGDMATLNITGSLNSATEWVIYTGSCGGTQVGTTSTSSFQVTPSTPSTTYFVRGEGGCVTSGSCGQVTVTVNSLPTVTFTALADLCIDAGVQAGLGGGTPPQGTAAGDIGVYSGTGVTDDGNGMTYSFDPAAAGVGTHTITYNYTDDNGCSGSANDDVEVFAVPTVTFTALADLCIDAGVQAGLGGGTPTGGVYSGTGVTDDGNGMTYSFDPAVAGVGVHTITYSFTDVNGCSGAASDDVEVFALPTVTFTALADLQVDAGVQAGLGGGTPTGGVYSGLGVTDDGNGMTYSFDPAVAGVGIHTITYTFTNVNGCTNSASDDVEVTVPADITPPTIASSNPADDSIGFGLTDDLTITFDENIQFGTGFIQLKRSSDDAAVFSIDAANPAATSNVASISGAVLTINPSASLAAETGFYLSIPATSIDDLAGNSFPGFTDNATLNFTTLDVNAPVFENSTPSSSSIAQTTFTLETDIDEAGTIYYVVVPDGVLAPTSAEVKAGTGSGGAGQITSGNAAVTTGGFTNDFSVTSLTAATDYDVYVVAEDDEGTPNLQASPTLVNVTTASLPEISFVTLMNSGLESLTSVNIPVDLSVTSSQTVTVDYAVTGGTATGSGTDYTLANGTLTYTPGDVSEDIVLSVVDDMILEENQTIQITISNPNNGVLGTNISYTYTINDDDTAAVTIADISGNEDDGAITVTAVLDNAVEGGFTIDVSTADGTATTADSDYTAVTSQTLTFTGTAGEMQTFSITPTVDSKLETDETITISQSNLAATILGVVITDGATLTITNDDNAAVTIADISGNEDDGAITVTVVLDNAVEGGFDLDVSTSDNTATTADSDYSAVTSQTLTFAGTASETETFTVALGVDTKVEADETINIAMSNLVPVIVDASDINITDTAIVTLNNDDSATVTIANVSGNEDDGAITVTVTLDVAVDDGFDVDVSTSDGTATIADSDYGAVTNQTLTFVGSVGESETFTVTPTADATSEADETLIIGMTGLSPITVSSSDIDITDGATITILNDDSISASINDPSVAEGASGSTTLQFTVSLGNPAPAGGATVDYATSDGSAISGTDYTAASGTVSFLVGETSKTVDITVAGDTTVEADETITLTLSNPTGTDVVIGDATGLGTIINDDSASVTITDVTPNEDDGTVNVTFTLDNAVDGGLDVDVSTSDNTATTADSDYVAVVSQTITFAGLASETETVTITLGIDTKVEADEIIDISMSNIVPVTVDSGDIIITDTGTVTIINDDTAAVTIADVSGNEDDGTITVTAVLDNAVQGGFTVDVSTADGTATVADSDYSAVTSQTLTFTGTAGEMQTFTVTPTADSKLETDETLTISQSNLAGTTLGVVITDGATVTINNDDTTVVTIADVSANENSGTQTITATLSNPVQGGFALDVFTTDGTATVADSDYSSTAGSTLTFVGTAGETQTLGLGGLGDTKVEADETFTISMTNVGFTSVDPADIDITDTATYTIINDDSASVTITDVTSNEDDGTVDVTFTLDNTVDGGFDVDVSTSDNTATTADSDYVAVVAQTITFAGLASETETVTITLGIDTKVEPDEIIDISMSSIVPVLVDSGDITITDTGTVTIINDDTAAVTISDISGNEDDGAITVTAVLDNAVQGGFTVDVSTADGTATVADSDYSAVTSQTLTFTGTAGEMQTFTVTPTADSKLETDETLNISQSNLAGTILGVVITDGATVTINNDDTTVVTIADISANENSGTQTITATLSNPVQGGFALDVFTTDGTATVADSDYSSTAGSTLTFAGTAGETQTLGLGGLGDTKVEADETFTISMTNVGFTSVDPADIDITDTATYTIINDDSASVTITDATSNEDDGTVNVTFTLDNAVDGGFDVDVSTSDNTATTADSDYVAVVAQTITFAGLASETETVTITLGIDTKVEPDEIIDISMSSIVPVLVDSGDITITDTGTVTIINDDTAAVTIADVSANEDDGAITVTAILDNAVEGGFTVDVSTADGTATTSDSDYSAVTSQTLTFTGTAGEMQTFSVTPTADSKLEADETLTISQSNLASTALSVVITDTATVTISNDDTAAVTITDVSGNEDDGAITVTAVLDNAVEGGFTVDVSTADGTATTADSDYTVVSSQTLTFTGTPGEMQTFSVTPTADSKLEADETLTISQSNLAGTVLGVVISGTATLTITNDDTATVTIADVSGNENDGAITVTAVLDNAVEGGFTVDVSTVDGTATVADGDYTAISETLIFVGTAGETQDVVIAIADDNEQEATEEFTMVQSSINGTTLSSNITITNQVIISITDDNDIDDDGILNNLDDDIDGDDQSNDDEIACGSDPYDFESISLDTDNDQIPDCVDDDDDNDQIPDVDDSNPLVPFTPDGDEDNDGASNSAEDTNGDGNFFNDDCDNDGIYNFLDSDDGCDIVTEDVSTGITPNSDGINDTWVVKGIEGFPNSIVKVYNRSGNEVFQAQGYQNDWDGIYKGQSKRLPAGSYYYVINPGDGSAPVDGWLFINY